MTTAAEYAEARRAACVAFAIEGTYGALLLIAATCHREKWAFENTEAFDVLHRIGDDANKAVIAARGKVKPHADTRCEDCRERGFNEIEAAPPVGYLFEIITDYQKQNETLRAEIGSIAKRRNDFNDQVNELRSRIDDMLAAPEAAEELYRKGLMAVQAAIAKAVQS